MKDLNDVLYKAKIANRLIKENKILQNKVNKLKEENVNLYKIIDIQATKIMQLKEKIKEV